MIDGFGDSFKIPELRKRVFFTVMMLVIYRVGVFVPTPGTRFAYCQPPAAEEAAAVLAYARRTLGCVPIQLGCMRPGGAYRRQLDVLAVKAGVNGIVNPTAEAVALAKSLGLAVERREECCVL